MKRSIDIVVASAVLALTAPLLSIIAMLLWLESGLPLLYRRGCVGLHGRPFDMLRFRTMSYAPAHRTPDERLTPVGRFIRNYSLDELPMLVNVVRGDMSLVGPRPTEITVVDLHDPEWQRIISVRPGVISYSPLRLARHFNSSDQTTRKQLELTYIDRHSMRFDFAVFRRAIRALIRSRGNVKARGEPNNDL